MCDKNRIFAVASAVVLLSSLADAQSPAFEVASIRPNNSGTFIRAIGPAPGGRFEVLNNTLRSLVAYAFGVDMTRQRLQIVGGPPWLDRDAFDIDAIAPGGAITPAQARDMLRALLEDRFKLKAHRETREVAAYDLVLDRDDRRLGPRLRASTIDCAARFAARRGGPPPPPPAGPTQRPECGLRQTAARFGGDAVSMNQLASALAVPAGRIVLDRTGLTGYYDADLDWSPGQEQILQPGAPPPTVDPSAPPVFTAIREQLGLRLEGSRAPIEVVVIDSAEPPTRN